MNTVFVLHHLANGDECGESAKMIGVYRSRDALDAAIARLSLQPGFKDYPEGFSVGEYELDKDHWREGFVKV